MLALDGVGNLPLGLFADQEYEQATLRLRPGDQIVFYTDGITEATNPAGQHVRRRAARRGAGELPPRRQGLIETVLAALKEFTGGVPPSDDQTLVVAKVL